MQPLPLRLLSKKLKESGCTDVPFSLVVPKSDKAQRTLLVAANNDFNKMTAPTHTGGDFYNYGGITRNVLLHTLPAATTIERVETFPISTSSLDVRVLLRGAATASVSLALSFDGGAAGKQQPCEPSWSRVLQAVPPIRSSGGGGNGNNHCAGVRTFVGSRGSSVDATFSDHAEDCA